MWHFPAGPSGRNPKLVEDGALLVLGEKDQSDALAQIAVVLDAVDVEVECFLKSPQSDELAHDTLFRLLPSDRCRL